MLALELNAYDQQFYLVKSYSMHIGNKRKKIAFQKIFNLRVLQLLIIQKIRFLEEIYGNFFEHLKR